MLKTNILVVDGDIAGDCKIEELNIDSDDDSNNDDDFQEEIFNYDGPCTTVVKKLIYLNRKLGPPFLDFAVFVPIHIFDKFRMNMLKLRKTFLTEHVWDYDLLIGDTMEPVKLIWINESQWPPSELLNKVKVAFSFLQPKFLRYMDKPFWNRDTFTQVNLVLDYHRTQKRRRGIHIFNVCDLIAFKMAIDDNRYEYELCEFHRLINRTLTEHIQSGTCMKDGKFDFMEYLGYTQDFRLHKNEIFEYLVYHFQKTIGSIRWERSGGYPIKLSAITNVPAFLAKLNQPDYSPTILIKETDSSGKHSEILYEMLTTTENLIQIIFELDGEWIYSGDAVLNQNAKQPGSFQITIDTKNSFNFIENFISWIKFAFGASSSNFLSLTIRNLEKIRPYVFYGLHLQILEITGTLACKLLRMLQHSTYRRVKFMDCRLENDSKVNFGLIGQRMESDQNIFKYLDECQNTSFIQLIIEEHTIGTLFAYAASVMRGRNLMEFQLKQFLWFETRKKEITPQFRRFPLNPDLDQIDVYTASGVRIDMYEFLNGLGPDEGRDEFDFYQ